MAEMATEHAQNRGGMCQLNRKDDRAIGVVKERSYINSSLARTFDVYSDVFPLPQLKLRLTNVKSVELYERIQKRKFKASCVFVDHTVNLH